MNSKIIAILLVLLAGTGRVLAGDGEYAVSKITQTLTKDASVVKRYEYVRYEVHNPGSASYYYRRAITILNEKGDEHSGWAEPYDRFTSIKSVYATLYDADGKKIRTLKKSDIADNSGNSEASLADDNRVKSYDFSYKVYPYTVEYEVEISRNDLLFMPAWMPVEDENYSVEKSIFQVVFPDDYKLRYKAYQYSSNPVTEKKSGKSIYTWQVENLAPYTAEYASPPWQRITPTVVIGASDFSIGKYHGSMNTWKEFGDFVYNLNQQRDKLPAEVAEKVHELTDKITDPKKKIEVLYDYMQHNTRYISIQLGIGGWQPFDATYVAGRKYGDCKALTNYMYSLLKEAGIESKYSLIKAGEYSRFMHDDFPAQQFNHAILSVPLEKDTVWLECTNQILPTGYLGSFTSDRYALMVDEKGGHLVRTTSYKAKDNLLVRYSKAKIDDKGTLTANVQTRYTGTQQEDLYDMLHVQTKKEQLESLKKMIDLPNYDINSFDYKINKDRLPSVDESLVITAENYAQVSGKRIFLQPNLINKHDTRLKDAERKTDIYFLREWRDVDTTEITVPNGYKPEASPAAVNLHTDFGDYRISYKVEGEKIWVIRYFEKKSGEFPKSSYPTLVKFYEDIYKADHARIVLVKKEE